MENLILLIAAVSLGYILAGILHKKSYSFSFLGKLGLPQGNISKERIDQILLQKNHGDDIDSVVENVRKNNASLPFNLLNSEKIYNEN